MKSSQPQSAGTHSAKLTANLEQDLTPSLQAGLFEAYSEVLPGSLNDAAIIRGVLIDSIRKCRKSRVQIAEEMTYLVGREITERMLNGFTAESRDDYRFPAELDRAFCKATGDDRLIRCRAEQAGYHVIDDTEAELLELGRQYLRRKAADESIALLEKRLHGRAL